MLVGGREVAAAPGARLGSDRAVGRWPWARDSDLLGPPSPPPPRPRLRAGHREGALTGLSVASVRAPSGHPRSARGGRRSDSPEVTGAARV